ncbi:NAD(P)-dependent dehydrogenase (short-subunit alcohol dehydrogenase family) [Nocardioides sp. BE266]|uniref:SDR family NAD(P)-dependent oxidoreductase n=1 Tax=Nocardioides sp. BE266 TaxID=2817725 RepID=UPI002855DE98|nr:SDR family oxidoreductase [Nocardioides sp. BE266]MDR7254267.1 NAD(P)-dependent dehydrogenase (short-subunit alcohol dehydrogenase family) [Nocardioides sp. BE266]
MDLGLNGARALVTGGTRGIGLAVGRALAAEGARVALLGRDSAALDLASAGITGAVAVRADTTDDGAVRAAVAEAADLLGGLDVVVNAAAPRARPSQVAGLEGVDDEDFLRQVDTKALGYVRVVRAAAPYLLDGGGRVVNVSGMNARATGSITGSVRNIAVVAITKNLADELGPQGVSVTCVHPGLTVTERVADDPAYLEQASQNGLARMVTADDVAAFVCFLASPLAAVANGSVISLDGGRPGPIWA